MALCRLCRLTVGATREFLCCANVSIEIKERHCIGNRFRRVLGFGLTYVSRVVI
jgi:hypothetical protein